MSETWAKAYRASLSESTRRRYGHLYDKHILPELGPLTLIEITPDVISRWQSDRLAAGGGAVAVRNAATLLGGILQRALESGHLQSQSGEGGQKDADAPTQGGPPARAGRGGAHAERWPVRVTPR